MHVYTFTSSIFKCFCGNLKKSLCNFSKKANGLWKKILPKYSRVLLMSQLLWQLCRKICHYGVGNWTWHTINVPTKWDTNCDLFSAVLWYLRCYTIVYKVAFETSGNSSESSLNVHPAMDLCSTMFNCLYKIDYI